MPYFALEQLCDYIADMDDPGVATLPRFLKEETRLALLEELAHYTLLESPTELGPHRVRQAFRSLEHFPKGSLFLSVRDELEAWLQLQFATLPSGYLVEPLELTEPVVQTYDPVNVGISAHRDGKSFVNLIAILVLEGAGRFCVCDDREGTNARAVRNLPGDLLLMRGYGFGGSFYQPFHFVDTVLRKRTTFVLRQPKRNL